MESTRQTFLMFQAGSFARLAVPLSLVARLEEIPRSKVERAGGKQVVQYRGRILQLVSLASILEPAQGDTGDVGDPAQVIVFSHGERSIGILVDRIVDIVEDQVSVRQSAARHGLLGSAVIGKQVTDLLDLQTVIEAVDDKWFSNQDRRGDQAPTILVAEHSPFLRGLVRNSLEMAGYRVVEAAGATAALEELERRKIDVVVAGTDLAAGGPGLVESMRRTPGLANPGLPVIDGLASEPSAKTMHPGSQTIRRSSTGRQCCDRWSASRVRWSRPGGPL